MITELLLDTSSLLESISTAESLLENVSDFSTEAREKGLAFIEGSLDLIGAEEIPADGTGNPGVTLKAGNGLLEFIEALRASERDLCVVK